MITLFIVDGDFETLYLTTSEKFSEVLKHLHIYPDRVKFKTIPMESIALMLDGQTDYIIR